jgi:hypothetical protein
VRLLCDEFFHQLGDPCTEYHHQVGCSAVGQCDELVFDYMVGHTPSSRNSLRMSISRSSCSSSHFVTLLTLPMGGEGVWVETCLWIDLHGVEKKKKKKKRHL